MIHTCTKCNLMSCDNYHYQNTSHNGHVVTLSFKRCKIAYFAMACLSEQCFSIAGTRPGTGLWHQLYRAARCSPGICNFSFLSNFHE